MAADISLNKILGDFKPIADSADGSSRLDYLTIRMPSGAKARYDKLQQTSHKEFGRKVRETIILLIELAESRAS